MIPELQKLYRLYRERLGANALAALRLARDDIRLTELCADGGYRIRWESDEDFSLDDWDYSPEADKERDRKKFQTGEWEALGVILERRRVCGECQHEMWEHVDSLWGIVLDDQDHQLIRRLHEVDLDF